MNPDPIMSFGKHKGQRISKIPLDYCDWALNTIDWNNKPRHFQQIRDAMMVRLGLKKPQPQQPPPRDSKDNEILVNQWYRQLCIEFHPDQTGGSRVPMQVLNRAKELLTEHLKKA